LNSQNLILFQIGLLFIVGIFLLRTLLNTLPILDKINRFFLKNFNLSQGLPGQRMAKATIFIIVVLLVMAAFFPIINFISATDSLLHQITAYMSLGSILFFTFNIGIIFYRMSETKANSVTAWILRIKNR
jgi:hypothetical protein